MDERSMKERFEGDGYVVLRKVLNAEELSAVRSELDRVIREVIPAMPREHVYHEDKSRPDTLKQLQMLHTHDRYFHDLFLGGRFERLAETLLGDKVVGKNLQYFSKPPGTGQPTPPHQDGYYFKLTPCEALTMWLALDDVDDNNGCVRYVRGSHRRGMRSHQQSNVLGFSQAITDYGLPEDLQNEVDMPGSLGDLLVHHALTIHSAGGNRSVARSRRSLGFIYFAGRSRPDEAAIHAYQERLNENLSASGKI